ncbi:hypothetical protein L1987_38411 [Smallanthus sonchifolius]|uniref:Uncharacterized protein n=1 Tax=Smallanthus sonchifolius TaxID=185202 RepID=A0ACB9HJ54_9ASTR|nr:hypothetical protein L1987_38411 [Smallanthus sonchifolius]
MASDHEIVEQIQILLTQSPPKSFTTLNDLVNQLSQTLGFDLSHKAPFIRHQINLLHLRSQPQSQSQSQYQNAPPSPVAVSGIPEDRFSYQQPQFHFNQHQHEIQIQQPHFVFQQPPHRQGHPVELDFSNPEAEEQLQALPEVKYEGVSVENAVWKSPEKLKKGSSANKRRGGPGGLNKLCGISPELQVIVGKSSLSRTDVCKQLWAYIKKNNLQDPGNKRKIICDDALRVVFETDCTDMFKMNKLLAKHIIPLEPTKESSRKKSKVNVEPKAESNDFVPCQVIISEVLANCLDMQEREMSESEVLRLVWEYIKFNNLEDPQNSVMVLCDEKLKELFGCETISAMEIPQFLIRHHVVKL